MKRLFFGGPLLGVVILLACFASSVWADDTFTITGANPYGYTNGDVYVSPYTATITNGASTLLNNGMVICDDYTDEVSVGQSWMVTASPASAVSGALFTNSVTWNSQVYSNAKAYDALAWLAVNLVGLSPSDPTLSADEAAYSYAIWTIFDPSAISDYVGNPLTVDSLITEAFAANYSGAGVTVWTPDPNKGPGNGGPQEFLTVQTPEAPSLANLAFDLTALLAGLFLVRRRMLRAAD